MDLFWVLMWIIIIFVIFVSVITTWIIWWWRVFKFKIEFYENIGGAGFERTMKGKARIIRVPGGGGEEVLWVPKIRDFLPAYGRKMGRKLFWYVKGQDGYWYNAILGDLDAKMGMLDIEPIDRDMRSFHTSNAKNIKERYNKPKNWPLILQSVTIVIVLLLMFGGGWLLFDKMNEGIELSNQNTETSLKVQQATAEIVVGLDNVINRGGSGIKPAT